MTFPLTTELSSADGGDMQVIVDTAQQAVVPHELDPEKPLAVVVPAGASLVAPDLNAWRSRPTRKVGTYLPSTVQSFVDYAKEHETPQTTVWVHPTSGHIEAVIDDHSDVDPAWREHRVKLDLERTPEWKFWTGADGDMMDQAPFAEHIENGLAEIVVPDAATMLEIAQTFHANVGSTFRSSIRLQSGQQQLQYDEVVSASAGSTGELTVPTRIELGIAPFLGEEPYAVVANLRFRVRSGNLSLGYKLDRPEAVIRDALDRIGGRLKDEFQRVYIGQPPA